MILLQFSLTHFEHMQGLERSLESHLEAVREQKYRAQLRDEAAKAFNGPLQPQAELQGFIDQRFVDAWGEGGHLRPSVVRGLLEEVCDGA